MAEAGTAIAAARLDAIARLAGLIERMREARGEGPFPWAEIALEGRLEEALSRLPATEVEDEFRRCSSQGRERDRAAARALEGPHLSDFNRDSRPEKCARGALLLGRAEGASDRADPRQSRADQGA